MTQTQRRRHPSPGDASTNAIKTTDSVPPAYDIPSSRAYAAPPCDGRTLWLIWIPRCSRCGGAHVHRTGLTARLLSGRLTKVCPVHGRTYQVAPVTRRREARRAAPGKR